MRKPAPARPRLCCRAGGALFALLLAPAAGCGRTVNDYLAEGKFGAPEAIAEAVVAIGELLAEKEHAGIPFDDGDRAALEFLATVARESQIPHHRAFAVEALGRLRAPHAAGKVIEESLKDAFWLVRKNAVDALRRQSDPRAVPLLGELLGRESHPIVRLHAVKALGHIGGGEAKRALFAIFLDQSPRFGDEQVQAYLALRRLTGLELGIHDRAEWQKAAEASAAGAAAGSAADASLPRVRSGEPR